MWFAGNAVITDLQELYALPESSLGHLTSSIQFGFIVGTLGYAILTISDRFSPSRVFFVSALCGAGFNLGIVFIDQGFLSMLVLRFLTGVFLAGIYPVGMKIASDYYEKGLGKALGYLVGALVLGTALPHLIKSLSFGLDWSYVLILTSLFSFIGGLIILGFVGDGPHHKKGKGIDLTAFFRVFKDKKFRSPAFGYFGHMWELYTFWAFVPVMIQLYNNSRGTDFNVSLWSFGIIGIGFLSCILGGYLSLSIGSRKTAFFSLFGSGICCVLSMWMLDFHPNVFLFFLFIWGILVIADSPQFSTLVARNAPSENKGTALTIVNCIGFSITIFSIELVNYLSNSFSLHLVMVVLVIGPLLGLIGLRFRNP
jgi:MFS family permease